MDLSLGAINFFEIYVLPDYSVVFLIVAVIIVKQVEQLFVEEAIFFSVFKYHPAFPLFLLLSVLVNRGSVVFLHVRKKV